MASSPLLTYAAIGVVVWWSWPTISPYVSDALDRLPQGHQTERQQSQQGADDYRWFETVVGNINREWTDIFRAEGHTYRPPTLVLYSGATRAPCQGGATSERGHSIVRLTRKSTSTRLNSWASSSTSLATAAAIPANS
jgi:Putative neutral zinc metallopeptidase